MTHFELTEACKQFVSDDWFLHIWNIRTPGEISLVDCNRL